VADANNVEMKQKAGLDLKIIIIGLLMFIVCLGVSYFLMKGLMAPLMPEEEITEKEKPAEIGVLLPIGEFMTNINDVAGSRYVKVDVTIESSEAGAQEKIDKYMPVIRDSIQGILSAKTVADLDIRNRDNLKKEIQEDINRKIGSDTVNNVYFTSFIMQ